MQPDAPSSASKTRIVTDAAADLTPAELATWGIQLIPLYIQFGNEEVSSQDITPDQFYDRLKAMWPQIPTTAQPSVGMFLDVYKKIAAAGDKVLSIHISTGLSGTGNTAKLAAEQLPEAGANVVDTMTLSCGERFQVLAAAMALKAGWPIEKILQRLAVIRDATETAFTIDTLDYLAKGGRIGRVQAIAGSILKIKPIIRVDKTDGKYSSLGRGRTIQQTMQALIDHQVSLYGKTRPMWATVVHGQFGEKAELFAKMLRDNLNIVRLEILRISPVLGVHTGPGVVGASLVPYEFVEDIV